MILIFLSLGPAKAKCKVTPTTHGKSEVTYVTTKKGQERGENFLRPNPSSILTFMKVRIQTL